MKRLIVAAVMVLSLTLGVGALTTAPARALSAAPLTQFGACSTGSTFFTFPTWYACLPLDSDGHPKLTGLNDIWLIAFPLIESTVKAAGYVAVGFVLWGGIKFIKSQGNPGEIADARNTMRDAIIGFVLSVSAVAVVQFIASRI